MKIKSAFLTLLILSGTLLHAQTLKDAIKMTENEQFNNAGTVFKKLLAESPTNGEVYFYYGENYFKNDNIDSAQVLYQKGADINATNPLNYVGLGKVQWFQKKEKEAQSNFYKATTLSQSKNATVLMKIAEAYTNGPTKNTTEAINLLGQAIKLEPSNPEAFILMGDAYQEKGDGNEAIRFYNKAAELDKKSVKAILRKGQLYGRAKNYNSALDHYKEASAIDSMFAPAYREKAELYGMSGQYPKAITQYKRYLELNNDYSARTRYAAFLYLSKQYQSAIDEVNNIQKKDTNTSSLYRVLGYSFYETAKYPEGLVAMNKFFVKAANGKGRIIQSDYEYLGKLLSKNGQDSLAAIKIQEAIKLDTSKTDMYTDLGNVYLKMKKNAEAIAAYNKRIASGKATPTDYLGIGRAYFFSKDFVNADSSFVKVTRSNPDLAIGYIWRAKANSQQDPKNEKWLAKPFYETYLSKLKPEEIEKNKKDVLEANLYLGYYCVVKKDYATAKTYFGKVRELDPANKQQKDFFASPEGK